MSEVKTATPPKTAPAAPPQNTGGPRDVETIPSSPSPGPSADEASAIQTRPIRLNWGFGRSRQEKTGE